MRSTRRRQTSRKFSAPSNKEKPRQFGGAAFWFAPGAGGIVTGANAYGDAGGPGLSIIPTLPANHSTPPMRQFELIRNSRAINTISCTAHIPQHGSGDCYGIYYDSKGESHRVYCGSWEEELLGKYYKARD
jgi:hypothetical protein